MSNNPFFSIIVPVYNTPEPYLKASLESLRKQTFADFEVLLVDDGSGEACAARLRAEAEKDARFRIIRQENAGVSVARNTGIENANGEWILFLDADDWLEENACERLHGYLNNTDADMLLFNGVKEYANGQKGILYALEHGKCYDFSDIAVKELFYRRIMQPPYSDGGRPHGLYFTWDKAYRRSFIRENKIRFIPGVRKSEDKLFISHCFGKLGKLRYEEEILYHYRINSESACNRYSATADRDRAFLIEQLRPVAKAMDEELSRIKAVPYTKVGHDLNSFIFAVISDVLALKYYHPDNPKKKTRRRDALAFLHSSPFKESLRAMSYREHGTSGKMKKFMLTHGFVDTYFILKSRMKRRKGLIAETAET